MSWFQVHQIWYDAATRAALDPGFLPLHNRNERPDWYELWPIREFLRARELAPDAWYGFLSPTFAEKTGLDAARVRGFLEGVRHKNDVALVSFGWDQVAYFQNPFEQGEVWHPGIRELSQALLRRLGRDVDLGALVTWGGNFTFSNFVVAKAAYWREWLALADPLVELVERDPTALGDAARATTSYGSADYQAPIKTFIQERLPALLLAERRWRVATLDSSDTFPIFEALFVDNGDTRDLLQACDYLKGKYCETGDPRFLEQYRAVRSRVPLRT